MKKLLAVALVLTSFSGFSYTSPEDAFEDSDFVDVVYAPFVSDEAIYLTKGYESLRGTDEYIEVIMMVNSKLADECGAIAEPSNFAMSHLIAIMADAQKNGNHDVVKIGLDKVTCAIFNQDRLNQELDAKKGLQTPKQEVGHQ